MHRLLIGFCILIVSVAWELQARKRWKRAPGSFRELFNFGSRATSPNKAYPALLFASLSVAIYAFWESFLRFILDRYTFGLWPWLGLALWAAWLWHRARVGGSEQLQASLHRWEPVAFLAICCVSLEAWFVLLLLPWIYFRSRFLPLRPAAGE
jgi:hypothetical protein